MHLSTLRNVALVLLLGASPLVTPCRAATPVEPGRLGPPAAPDDSLYSALSRMPLDSLSARQYEWLTQERKLREVQETSQRTHGKKSTWMWLSMIGMMASVMVFMRSSSGTH